jgi:hypothetical protein
VQSVIGINLPDSQDVQTIDLKLSLPLKIFPFPVPLQKV